MEDCMSLVNFEFILFTSDEERLFAVRLPSLKLKKITGSVGSIMYLSTW